MCDNVPKRKSMLSFEGSDVFNGKGKEKLFRTQLSTDLTFGDGNSSPQLPPTPFAPFLHFKGCEPLDLEPSSPINFTQKKSAYNAESCWTLDTRFSLEKEEALSQAQTHYSSTLGQEARDDDSEDYGVPFSPLANSNIKVWVMDVVAKNTAAIQKPSQKDNGQNATTILGLLKSKRLNQTHRSGN